MSSKEPEKQLVSPRNRIRDWEKLNLYIPSNLHEKFPNLKPFETTRQIKPTIKKRTNLMSNTQIINVRGIANSIQLEKSRSTGMMNHTRNHNTIHVNSENPEAENFKDSLFKLTNLYFEENPTPALPDHKL